MNPFISLFDETYNSDYSDTYILNLYKCNDFLAYTVIDSVRKKFIALRAFATDDRYFSEQIAGDEYLLYKYKKVSLMNFQGASVLVPASVFSEEYTEKFYTFSCGEVPLQSRIVSARVNDDIVCCFSYPDAMAMMMKPHEGYNLIHPASVIVNKMIRNFRSAPGICAELYKQGIVIAAAGSGVLKYYNYFPCSAASDYAYHVTAVYRHLGFSLSEVALNYSGITSRNDERLAEISRFVSIIKPFGADTDYLFSYRFNEIQQHGLSLLYDFHYADYKR